MGILLNMNKGDTLETLYEVAGMIALTDDADVYDIWLLDRKVMPVGAPYQVSVCSHYQAGLH